MTIRAAVLMGLAVTKMWAGSGAIEHRVPVCLGGINPSSLAAARWIASKMFADVGVQIEWRRSSKSCLALTGAIAITLSTGGAAKLAPNALAYALPYDTGRIVVYYDRIGAYVESSGVPSLLAHVLVHEITHVLEGSDAHSYTGVMKAHWDGSDYSQMFWKPLPFTEADRLMIRIGLAARDSREAAQVAKAASPASNGYHRSRGVEP